MPFLQLLFVLFLLLYAFFEVFQHVVVAILTQLVVLDLLEVFVFVWVDHVVVLGLVVLLVCGFEIGRVNEMVALVVQAAFVLDWVQEVVVLFFFLFFAIEVIIVGSGDGAGVVLFLHGDEHAAQAVGPVESTSTFLPPLDILGWRDVGFDG